MATPQPPRQRDLRLDFFRGLALFFIFIDHIPNNLLSWFTLWAIGFSDAAEVFIFISGYAAAMVYGGAMRQSGPLVASAQVLHRVWQLYVAHVFLFIIYTAMVAYTMATLDNPLYAEELRVGSFLSEPDVAILKALALLFQPTFLDILPLYIVLLLVFPLILMALARGSLWALLPSLALYAAAHLLDFALTAYPDNREWVFNPFAWQLLFTIGATCGYARVAGRELLPRGSWLKWLLVAAGLFLAASFVIRLSWTIHLLYSAFPGLLLKQLYPISKTDLAPLRLLHFLALAFVVVRLVRADNRLFASRFARPVLICGQHSLNIFCLGILLSLAGHFILTEVSDAILVQLAANAAGIGLMIGAAAILDWYKSATRRAPRPAPGPAPEPQATASR